MYELLIFGIGFMLGFAVYLTVTSETCEHCDED